MIIKKFFKLSDFLNSHDVWYVETNKLRVTRWLGQDAWEIVDLKNALLPGAFCTRIHIANVIHSFNQENALAVSNWIGSMTGGSPGVLFEMLMDMDWEKTSYAGRESWAPIEIPFTSYGKELKLQINRSEIPGPRVWSPFHYERLRKLTAVPGKWTLAHVKRALANGQFTDLKCTMHLTDDFAWDAADNFGRRGLCSINFLKELVEAPSGWRCYPDGTDPSLVHVNCHSFDFNSFIFNLEGANA